MFTKTAPAQDFKLPALKMSAACLQQYLPLPPPLTPPPPLTLHHSGALSLSSLLG